MEQLLELLLNPEQVSIVLQSISSYVIYIYPGIISIYWNNFLEARSTQSTQALLIKSFSISYLYNILLGCIFPYKDNVIKYNALLVLISILLPFFYVKFRYSKIVACICDILRIRTCMTSVPFELLKDKEEKYTCLKIYLNNEPYAYIGFMDNYNYEYERDKEKFVILVGYKKYICVGNEEELVVSNKKEQYDQKVFIKYSDIKIVEKIAENIAMNEIYNDKNIIISENQSSVKS
ncbi:MAG: hypothetical protein NC392_09295 [Roseburia sp.]|nr:hypothetical protein [Roseburia sp.]